jgi:photosystem II stability/assembly factor-like uncharacterized protein
MKKLYILIFSCLTTLNLIAQSTWTGILSSSENGLLAVADVNDILYKIKDSTWIKLCNMPSVDLKDIKIDSQKNILVFYKNNIKLSKNEGLTWTTISKPSDGGNYGEIFGDYLYLKGNNKIYRKNYISDDINWTLIYSGQYEDITVTSNGVIFISQYDRNIIKSTDNGASWVNTKWSAIGEFSTPGELNTNNNKLYVGTYWSGVYVSSDNGDTWVHSTGLPANRGVTDVVFLNGNVYALVRDQLKTTGLYLSTDNGLTFTKFNTGLNFWSEQSLNGFTANGNNFYLSVDYWGFFLSTNNGQRWTEINNGINNIFPHNIKKIQTDNSGVVWTLLGTNGIGPNRPTWGVMKSIDKSVSWLDANGNGLIDDYQTLEDMVVTPCGNVFVTGYDPGTVFKSTDSGKNWEKNKLTIGSTISVLAADNKNDTILAGTYWDGIIRTVDGGKNWIKITDGIPDKSGVSNIFITKDTILAVFENQTLYDGIYKSTNYGGKWAKISGQRLQKVIIKDGILYGTMSNKVFQSIDGGTTWTDFSTNIPTNCNINSFFLAESNQKSTDKLLFISTNIGLYFSKVNTPQWAQFSPITTNTSYWDSKTKEIISGSDTKLSISVVNSLVTDVKKEESAKGLMIFPNPSSDFVTISWSIPLKLLDMILYDNSGKVVLNKQINNNESISIHQLIKGIYLYKLLNKSQIFYTGKLLVH